MEDDVRRIIMEHPAEFSVKDAIQEVQSYGEKVRGYKYEEADIRHVIDLGMQRRELQEVKGKLVYIGPKRRKVRKPR